MSETATRRFRLPLNMHPVSWVDAGSYPAAGGCHIICLSDRQCAIIRDMVSHLGSLPTRFAVHLYGETFTYGDSTIFEQHKLEVNELFEQIGEGSSVACTELVAALSDLAAALAGGAGGGTTMVTCGSGGGSMAPINVLANCVGELPIEAILPGEDIENSDPEGDPPEGFDTWEEYNLYRCKAAHWVVDTIINSLRNFGAANLIGATLSLVTAVVAGAIAAFVGIMAPPAFLAIVVALVQLDLLAGGANVLLRQVADHLATHRAELICAMYNSSSAADAVTLLNSALEDALEAIVYGATFSALAGAIEPLLSTIVTAIVDLKITRTLWTLSADVIYFDADCDPCDPWYGYLAATSSDSPYNVLDKGDSVTFGDNSAENGYQVIHPTPGRIYFTTDGAVTSLHLHDEYYHVQSGWTVCGAQIFRASDDADMGSFDVPDSNGSWQTIDDTASISLAAATQYYVRLSPSGGNSTWHRRLSLLAL